MKEKLIFSLVFQLATYIITVMASYLLALNLNVGLLGLWAFIGSFLNIGFLFIDMGFTSIHYQYSGKSNFQEYFGTFLFIKLLLIGLNIGFTLILITIFQFWTASFLPYIIILMLCWGVIRLTEVFQKNLKSKKKIIKCEIITFIFSTVQSMITIYLAINLSLIKDPLLFLSISSFLVNSLMIISIILLSRKDLTFLKPRRDLLKSYLKDTKPLIIYNVLNILATNLGSLILFYTSGEVTLAYYTIIYTYIISALLIIPSTLAEIYMIYYAEYFEKKNMKAIKEVAYVIEKYSSILFLIIIIIVYLNSELIFTLFLPNYVNSLPILYILIFIPFLTGITSPYVSFFIAGKKQKQDATIRSILLFFKLFLLIILIPQQILMLRLFGLGVFGYAYATLIPYVCNLIIYRYYAKKYFEIHYQKAIFLQVFLAIVCFCVAVLIKNIFLKEFLQSDLLLLLSSTIIALGMFIVILIIAKQLNKQDFRLILELLNIKKYTMSLKEEL